MSEKLTGADLEQALKDRGLPIEGTADEKRAAVAKHDETTKAPEGKEANETATAAPSAAEPDTKGTTTLDDNVEEPSVTAPGDGPADTTDPSETAHSVTPQPSAEALTVGTVNAVLPGPKVEEAAGVAKSDQRIEKYKAVKPDGTEVTVTHNIDTGETSVS